MPLPSFSGQVLDLGILLGTAGEYRGDSTRLRLENGQGFVGANWVEPRVRWELGDWEYTWERFQYLKGHFMSHRGQGIRFPFRDPGDEWFDEVLGVGDGVKTEFEIWKTYNDRWRRRIYLPRGETLQVSVGGVIMPSGWWVANDGILRFGEPVLNGAEVRVSGRYYHRCRYGVDQLESRLEYAGVVAGEEVDPRDGIFYVSRLSVESVIC